MHTILVASDAPTLRSELRAALEGPDTEVREASSGPDAGGARAGVPDLVIVDLQMGNMGGMAVCLELRLAQSYGHSTTCRS